jgi:hypothetical protein
MMFGWWLLAAVVAQKAAVAVWLWTPPVFVELMDDWDRVERLNRG